MSSPILKILVISRRPRKDAEAIETANGTLKPRVEITPPITIARMRGIANQPAAPTMRLRPNPRATYSTINVTPLAIVAIAAPTPPKCGIRKKLRIPAKYIRKVINTAREDYNIHVIACNDRYTAEKTAYRILKKAHELYVRR